MMFLFLLEYDDFEYIGDNGLVLCNSNCEDQTVARNLS